MTNLPCVLALERADQPDVVALIEPLDAFQRPLYPEDSQHGIPIEALLRPEVVFAVARDAAGQALACGAIVLAHDDGLGLGDGATWGEVKRMYVQPALRGSGLAGRLLTFLEAAAQQRGCQHFALETGIRQPAALGLYRRHRYAVTGPFGRHRPDPLSVFMRKPG